MVSISDLKSKKGGGSDPRPSAAPGQATRTKAPENKPETVEQLANKARMQAIDRDPNVSAYDLGQGVRDFKEQNTEAQQSSARLREDFSALQEGKVDEVRDWKGIAEATLYISQQDDPESQEVKNALLWQYGDQLRPHIEAAGGEDWWEENYQERPEVEDDSFLGWKGKVAAVADTGLFDYLDQWGQDALGVVSGISSAIDTGDGVSAGDGIAHAIRSGARAVDVTRALPGTDGLSGMLKGDASTFITSDGRELSRDLDGDGSLNLREALGKDPEAGGRLLGAIDLIGTMVLDPTTYVTFGAATKAKLGLRGVEELSQDLVTRGLIDASDNVAPAIVRQIRNKGLDSLTKAESELFEELLQRSVRTAMGETPKADRVIREQMSAVRRGGQDGMRFAGFTLIPTTRLSNALQRLGVTPSAVFRRAPREAVQLGDEVAEIADEILEPGALVPFMGDGVDDAANPNWQFYTEGDRINVAAPDGRIINIPTEQLEGLMALLSDMELAYMARNNSDMLALLPQSRRTVVNGLLKVEGWEDGADGLVRRVLQEGTDETVEGVAGALPSSTGSARSSVGEAGPEVPDVPSAPASKLPVPRRSDDIVPFVDEGADPGWRFADTTGMELVPSRPGGLVPAAVRREVDEVLDEIAEATVEGAERIDDVLRQKIDDVGYTITDASVKGGWFAKLMEIPKVASIVSRMTPRAFVKARYGQSTADLLGELLSRTRADAQASVSDIMTQVGADLHKNRLLRSAIDEAGSVDALMRTLDDALANPERFDEILAELGENQGNLLRSLDSARRQIFEATLRGQGYTRDEIQRMMDGLMDLPANMHEMNSYIPRVLSSVARNDSNLIDQLRNLDSGTGPLGGRSDDQLAESFLKRRSITDTDSIFGANSEVAQVMREAGIEAPEQMFETNIPAAFAVRSRSAFEAAAEIDLLDGIMGMTGPNGRPLGVRITPDELADARFGESGVLKGKLPPGARAADYRRIETASGVVYRVDKTIADELENVRRVFGDPKAQSQARDLYDKMNNVWAMSATVGLVNPGFHIRNTVGNWFNMVLGGVRDPSVLGRSAALQNTNRKIRNRMAEAGESYEAAARALDIDADDLRILEGARRTGVLGDSRALDITRAEGGRPRPVAPTEQTLGSKLNPASADSMLNRPGVVLGETVEGNSRLAMYIDQINKGASPNAAAAHVKQHLFDYGDLTRFENESLRRISRFYTFTRKNTALQFYALTRYPGRVANAQTIIDSAVQGFLDPLTDEDGNMAVPEWMEGSAVGTIPFTDQAAALKVDTTFNSAEDLASMFTDLLQERDPLDPTSRWGAFFEKVDTLFSGIGISAVDTYQEFQTGRDSFTGRPLGGDARDHWLFRVVETALPALARGERLLAQSGADIRENDASRSAELMALNWLGGLQVAELDDDATGSARSSIIRELENLQSELQERYGLYDPETNPDGMMSLSDMRKASELNEKNRIMNALMYSWTEGPDGELVWSDEAQMQNLMELVPSEVLQAFGIDPGEDFRFDGARDRPETEDEEVLARRNEQDLATAMEAFAMWRGEPLTDEEKLTFLVASPWAPSNTMLEGLGLEPYRANNRFVEGEEEPSYAAQLADAEEALSRLATTVGLDPSTLSSLRPRLSEFQRVLDEAEAAGISQAHLHEYITQGKGEGRGGGVLSRNDRAFINQLLGYEDRMNGFLDISETRRPEVTAEDQQKIAIKAWEAEEEYVLFSRLFGLPTPSQEQIETYVANSIMTSGTLEDLGYVDLKGAKNREDIRTDAERYQDSLSVQEAMDRRGPAATLFD